LLGAIEVWSITAEESGVESAMFSCKL